MPRFAVLMALIAAALFGLSTPLAKQLVGAIDPWLLAALFYLGSGIGLALLRLVRGRAEAPLTRSDLPWLAGAVLSGGVVGPILLMIGLARTGGTAASLLLTLEGVATALIAWFVFRENFDRRIALGMGAIVAGAAMIAWQGGPSAGEPAGPVVIGGPMLIAGACIAWGIDNNLTRKVSLADPLAVAMIKGLAAGPVSLALALANGAALPGPGAAFAAAVVGFFGYGLSLALFVLALRHLGSARTGAYFSTAPFLGAAFSIPLLGEEPTWQLALAGALMAAGVWLHLTERHEHEHEHEHEPLEHEHRHVHDRHHRHRHAAGDPPGEPHTHRHVHARLRHAHAHTPDMHHRHRH